MIGLGAGAGAVVPAVAVQAALGLIPASWKRAEGRAKWRWFGYVTAGIVSTVLLGAWLVLVLLACGFIEMASQKKLPGWLKPGRPKRCLGSFSVALAWPRQAPVDSRHSAGPPSRSAPSHGGGFVIIPMMEADAVDRYHWLTAGEFLNAVALGQATPGPVVQTVAVVGYGADGLTGAIIAAVVAFAPSFWFIALGADRFKKLRTNPSPLAFLEGAGPAAIGAILGAAIPLTMALSETCFFVLAAGAIALLLWHRSVILVIVGGAVAGTAAVLLGATLPA